jgi:hypothetical protein
MSYYRNVQDAGIWQRGGTYTFEVDNNIISVGDHPHVDTATPVQNGWNNYWCSHGRSIKNSSGVHIYFENPVDTGFEWSSVQLAPYYRYEIVEGEYTRVITGPDSKATRSGNGFEGPGSHWTYSKPSMETVHSCEETTADYDRKFDIYSRTPGNILFNNNSENLEGSIDGLEVLTRELLGDGWVKYTVYVGSIPAGTYYIKGKTYHWLGEEGLPT